MYKLNSKNTQDLYTAILTLKNIKEAKCFFRDLLTEQEIIEFGNRWKAARMLDRDIPYAVISKETGLSSTTVARISRWLKKGMGGYRFMLKRLNLHHGKSDSFGKGLH